MSKISFVSLPGNFRAEGRAVRLALFPLNIKAVFPSPFKSLYSSSRDGEKRQKPGAALYAAGAMRRNRRVDRLRRYFHLTAAGFPRRPLINRLGSLQSLSLVNILRGGWYKPPKEWKPEPPEGLGSVSGE